MSKYTSGAASRAREDTLEFIKKNKSIKNLKIRVY